MSVNLEPTNRPSSDRTNPVRIETAEEAVRIDARIAQAWEGHPRRHFVESTDHFLEKLHTSLRILEGVVPACCQRHFADISGAGS